MYNAVKSAIQAKKFDLTEILAKIDILWVEGRLTDEQRVELVGLAQGGAIARNSIDIYQKLQELDRRVRDLEDGEADTGTEETEAYPEYVAGKWYYAGDKCSEVGVNYVCIAPEGQVCTWSPSEYPAYWEAAA